jgi:hypothetical protein
VNGQEHFKTLVEGAARTFASSLRDFHAWSKEEGITERNLSFHMASEFLRMHTDGRAFMELAFKREDALRTDNHLDAYCYTSEAGYLVECKQLYELDKLREMASDMKRLQGTSLLAEISRRHVGVKPRQLYAVVMADVWRPDLAKWWQREADTRCKWSREGLPDDWEYGCVEVSKVSDGLDGHLHWVFGISPALAAWDP